ncbi:MAG: TIGR02996 domain-containing protein [Proteobacteria bacterium]|nr:TIGR02996 domain-containing protein [Pseudomonadota bacterium]
MDLAEAAKAWRVCRRRELADLVDALATTATLPAIIGRTKERYQKAWMALAVEDLDDPATTCALAAGLARSIPVRATGYLARDRDRKRYQHFIKRIGALMARAHDPQIARALCELLEHLPFSVDDNDVVLGPVLVVLRQQGDERSVLRLRALLDHPVAKTSTLRDWLARVLPKTIASLQHDLKKQRPALPAGVVEQLAALRPASGQLDQSRRATANLDALLAECLAHPTDHAPRLVYADALLEASDPRGELFAAEPKRVASILRKHEKRWLGDITRVTKLRVWRRGFLDEAELLQGASADPATWERVAADPRMATVRTLHKGTASEQLYGTFVTSRALVALRDVEIPSTKLLAKLVTSPRPLDRIALTGGLSRETMKHLGPAATATGVRRLAFATKLVPAALVEQLAAWPGRAQFDELCALPSYQISNTWRAQRDRWLGAFDRLGVSRLGYGDLDDYVIVERGPNGVWSIDARLEQQTLLVDLATRLTGPVDRISIRGTPLSWTKPTAALGRAIAKLKPKTLERFDGWLDVSI